MDAIEINCESSTTVVVTKTIFDRLWPFHLRDVKCRHCQKHLRYDFCGTEEELDKKIEEL